MPENLVDTVPSVLIPCQSALIEQSDCPYHLAQAEHKLRFCQAFRALSCSPTAKSV